VVLMGDAAHAGPPTMGIVGCMAMEDAYVLVEELRTAGSVEHALEAYTERAIHPPVFSQGMNRPALSHA
jgi:2-polyprenyl-6-methoxyphenol hydroxylase-like FAD-dependent oxidoreductase